LFFFLRLSIDVKDFAHGFEILLFPAIEEKKVSSSR
jgi:hypothetical protein